MFCLRLAWFVVVGCLVVDFVGVVWCSVLGV